VDLVVKVTALHGVANFQMLESGVSIILMVQTPQRVPTMIAEIFVSCQVVKDVVMDVVVTQVEASIVND
jgi:hypothetical protein